MIFDNENCSNIDVINGKAIDDGNRTTIIGYGLPGMQESIGCLLYTSLPEWNLLVVFQEQ